MIAIAADLLQRLSEAAESAYPDECCGLLVGHGRPASGVVVRRIVPSANVALGSRRDRFEVDPKVRFRLRRELAGGVDAIVGHYHSHPDRPAKPSRRDAEMAWEPELVWLIASGRRGRVVRTAAYAVDGPDRRFRRMTLSIDETPRPSLDANRDEGF